MDNFSRTDKAAAVVVQMGCVSGRRRVTGDGHHWHRQPPSGRARLLDSDARSCCPALA
jgi:hypothetical protein